MSLPSVWGNARLRRYAAFLFAGGSGFAMYLALSNLFHYGLGWGEVASAVAGALLPIPPTYLLQRKLTFKERSAGKRALPMYVALQACNACLTAAVSALCARTSLPGYAVFLIAGISSVLVSYWVQSKLIFRKSKGA